MYIGKALYQMIQAKDCTISNFARIIGMTRGQLYKILHDEHSPTLATVERLCDALDLSISEFIALIEELNQEFI